MAPGQGRICHHVIQTYPAAVSLDPQGKLQRSPVGRSGHGSIARETDQFVVVEGAQKAGERPRHQCSRSMTDAADPVATCRRRASLSLVPWTMA
jgi:hypothetical protein